MSMGHPAQDWGVPAIEDSGIFQGECMAECGEVSGIPWRGEHLSRSREVSQGVGGVVGVGRGMEKHQELLPQDCELVTSFVFPPDSLL